MENEKWKMKSIRMCVVCRERFYQNELNRLQCKDKRLISFSGIGRSFYVCNECINTKKFINYIAKICKVSKEDAKNQIFHFPFSIVK